MNIFLAIIIEMKIGIFSGSKFPQDSEELVSILEHFAKTLDLKHTVVYGGGESGLMGIIPKTFHTRGGHVIGYNTSKFIKYSEDCVIGKQIISDSFHTRQANIIQNSDIYITLPGGVGTVFELFDTLVANDIQLGKPKKIYLFNYKNIFDGIIKFIENAVSHKLIKPSVWDNLFVITDLKEINFD